MHFYSRHFAFTMLLNTSSVLTNSLITEVATMDKVATKKGNLWHILSKYTDDESLLGPLAQK